MLRILQQYSTIIILICLIAIGAFFRFYNLNWGAPYYFHPDERNIASSVSRLQFPDQMNPHFFAYGSLPIYTIYFTGLLYNFFSTCHVSLVTCSVSFEQAIVISRIFSAVFSLALLPLLYLLGKKMKDQMTGIIAVLLGAVSVGFIQFAHFGTFELWLTFFSALLIYIYLRLNQEMKTKYIVVAGLVFGILLSIKVSSLALIPLPFIALFLPNIHHARPDAAKRLKRSLLFIAISGVVYFLTNPFVLLDFPAFRHSMNYESSVALGTLPVFYTGEFYNTIPVLYQFLHIYPFLLNPLLTILFILAFVYVLFLEYKTKHPAYLLLVTCYLLLFLSQAFLFVKWTRYMGPTLPFVYLILALSITDILQLVTKKYQVSSIKYIVFSFLITISAIFALAYVITAFVQTDTRIAASIWAKQHIPSQAKILSESYDLGIVPFNADFPNISLFNFYDLDSPALEGTYRQLTEALRTNEYIILPSQRIYQTRSSNAGKFPSGNRFYTMLLSNQLGFTKIYETPCDIFCKITYLNNPIFSFEQTASVFDRPTVYIFQKYATF